VETLKRLSGIELAMVVDKDAHAAEQVAQAHGIPAFGSDYRDAIADDSIDVIHVCSPNSLHYEQSKAALESGKAVFSEKPLAINSAQAQELYDLSLRKNAVTGIDFCYRYYPVVLEARQRIRDGFIGDVRMVTGSWFQDWLFHATDYSWRLEKSESGDSNVAADLGSHWFDLIRFTTGLSVAEILADFKTLIPQRIKPRRANEAFSAASGEGQSVQVELEEYAAMTFRLEGNVPGTFTACQACAGRKSETEFQIYGSKGSLAWNHARSNELWIGKRDEPNQILIEGPALLSPSVKPYSSLPGGHPLGYYDAVYNLFSDFYRAVEEGTTSVAPNLPTFYHGTEEMLLLDKIVESVQKRSWISYARKHRPG
jgi:predicted dehydrogenase